MTTSSTDAMRQVTLGHSGMRVSEFCLGTMTFGTDWPYGATADEAESREIYRIYRDAGGNFVDTANMYTDGQSEEIVGRLVAGHRDEMVIATKFTLPAGADPNSAGGHRKSLRRSVETSLQRLGVDYLDLLWVHAWDQRTPVEETLQALHDLVSAGKVLAVGVSNTPAWVVAWSQAVAELRSWSRYCAVQIEYSLAQRTPEREFLPMARTLGLALAAWSPLGRGRLVGKPAQGAVAEVAGVVAAVASEVGASPAQIALAWLRSRQVIPVLGASRTGQMEDNLRALQIDLDEKRLARLDEATRVPLGYPHDFLAQQASFLACDPG
jgi:aryl-alcohol dehydrogenase-like predicted oxidoreductase